MAEPEQEPNPINVWKLRLEEVAILYAADQDNGTYGYEVKQMMGTAESNEDSIVYRLLRRHVEKGHIAPYMPSNNDKSNKKSGPKSNHYKTTPLGRAVLAEYFGVVAEWIDYYNQPDNSSEAE